VLGKGLRRKALEHMMLAAGSNNLPFLGIRASSGRQIALSSKLEPLPPLLLRYLTKFEPKGSRHPLSQLLVRSSSTRPAGHIGTRR
jgi:hypothetical protein